MGATDGTAKERTRSDMPPSVSPETGGLGVTSPAAYSAGIVGFRNPVRLFQFHQSRHGPVTPIGRL
jgi:hypothetical protein